MSRSSVSFKWNTAKLAQVRQKFGQGLLRMGADIASKARGNAPVLTGNLVRSIRIDTAESSTDIVVVKAGGKVDFPVYKYVKNKKTGKKKKVFTGYSIPYARRREYENNLHPGTKYYMHRAFDTVVRGNIGQYFKGATK